MKVVKSIIMTSLVLSLVACNPPKKNTTDHPSSTPETHQSQQTQETAPPVKSIAIPAKHSFSEKLEVAKQGELMLKPTDAGWDKVSALKVTLQSQAIVPPKGGGKVQALEVQAIHNDKQIAFRVSWDDDSESIENGVDTFKDAMALQFPTKISDTPPSPFMGNEGSPVNIWQWRADWQADLDGRNPLDRRQPKVDGYEISHADKEILKKMFPKKHAKDATMVEFIAEGWGTLTRQKKQDVNATGVYSVDQKRWSVVFYRDIERTEEADAIFPIDKENKINFAVWDGGSEEVNGKKSLSMMWIPYSFKSS